MTLGLAWTCSAGCVSAEANLQHQEAPAPPLAEAPDVVDAWLDRIAERTQQIDTLTARLRYTTIQGLLEDRQVRFGRLSYAATDEALGLAVPQDEPGLDGQAKLRERLAVHFHRKQIDGLARDTDEWIIYDGDWLLERDAAKQPKQATRRALRPMQNANGELADPALALPISIRFDRAELQARYDIQSFELDPADPTAAVGIVFQLTPKPGQTGDPTRLTFDPDTLLPLEIRTRQANGDETHLRLFQHDVNPRLDAARFSTELPQEPGWDTQAVPFGE